eukprot:Gregarina_sp_Poly_1__1237@NODE_12_length_23383_cov_104_521445_g10_i0_p5_GENE_NODE_12_length_23383_cov_104_521445_g10_i0NODE_12_length_23383_cov_104_521445_g10_i0_p5_ORF_typecomplete_len311_score27_32Carb_anhydrase/PF00194_21/3_6e27_NODE_12_length_23383_cov_104_521445_g10_i01473415666
MARQERSGDQRTFGIMHSNARGEPFSNNWRPSKLLGLLRAAGSGLLGVRPKPNRPILEKFFSMPAYTYDLHDWAEYSHLPAQSPVDLPKAIFQPKQLSRDVVVKLRTTNRPMTVDVSRSDKRVAITGSDLSTNLISINGKKGYMKEIHFHSPAEHLMGGKQHHSEMHCVFIRKRRVFAVVGLILVPDESAEPNEFFSKFDWQQGEWQEHIEFSENFILSNFMQSQNNKSSKYEEFLFLNYQGSLTTPPCTEGVQWFVQAARVRPVELEFLNILRTCHGGNFRYPHVWNGRPLQLVAMKSQIRTFTTPIFA